MTDRTHFFDHAQLIAAMDTGDWAITKSPEWTNSPSRLVWSVTRQTAPFCDDSGTRLWSGATAMEALTTAAESLRVPLPYAEFNLKCKSLRKRLAAQWSIE